MVNNPVFGNSPALQEKMRQSLPAFIQQVSYFFSNLSLRALSSYYIIALILIAIFDTIF